MNRPSILITIAWPDTCLERARARYIVEVADATLDRAGLAAALVRYDALCPTITDRIDAGLLGLPARRVEMIANYGAGYDNIDVAAASRAGIRVSNTPDVLTDATAETAVMLMLMAARRAGQAERRLRAGRWSGWRPTGELGVGLAGKRLGLIGFGRIAQATARLAAGLGMRPFYTARRRASTGAEQTGSATFQPDLAVLLAEADVVSLHCPGGAETYRMIDAAALARMKPDAILINTARGSVVDEGALADALLRGTIAAAGLDVYEREPHVHPGLLACETAVLLPHIGSATVETRVAMGMRALDNLDAFFDGRPLPDAVA